MRSRRLIKLGSIELVVWIDDPLAGKLVALKQRLKGKSHAGAPEPTAIDARPKNPTAEQKALYEIIDPIQWYHSIDLGHGVVTPGFFDHRPRLDHYHLPESLEGKRVLDVATFDGFWALEFEKRGASEVVAVDLARVGQIDLAPSVRASMTEDELKAPLGNGFRAVRQILGSNVKREEISVYDLSPERIGRFDFVFCSDLLIHLQNPVRALQAIHSVCDGSAQFVELCDMSMQRHGPYNLLNYMGAKSDHIWWNFGEGTLMEMIRDAGFAQVEEIDRFDLCPRGYSQSPPHIAYRASTGREGI